MPLNQCPFTNGDLGAAISLWRAGSSVTMYFGPILNGDPRVEELRNHSWKRRWKSYVLTILLQRIFNSQVEGSSAGVVEHP